MEPENHEQRARVGAVSIPCNELVLVVWRDAHADRSGSWLDLEDIDDEPYIVHSAGFLLRDVKKNHVSIAQSLGADDGVVDHVLHVPKEMVIAVTSIELPKVKRSLLATAGGKKKK